MSSSRAASYSWLSVTESVGTRMHNFVQTTLIARHVRNLWQDAIKIILLVTLMSGNLMMLICLDGISFSFVAKWAAWLVGPSSSKYAQKPKSDF